MQMGVLRTPNVFFLYVYEDLLPHIFLYASTILPAIADAAAVFGDPKYISTLDVPILPKKLRLFVARTRSPSVMIPPARPQHNPHPGCVMIAPASAKIFIYPASTAWCYDQFYIVSNFLSF